MGGGGGGGGWILNGMDLLQFGRAQPFFPPILDWFRLWIDFGTALIQTPNF